jgi:hypothetical protein
MTVERTSEEDKNDEGSPFRGCQLTKRDSN